MDRDALEAVLTPHLRQDARAVLDELMELRGALTAADVIQHLQRFDAISDAAARSVAASLPSDVGAPPVASPPPTVRTDPPPRRTPAPAPARPATVDDDWEEIEVAADTPKRTMFRKLTGGALKETGRFGEEQAPTRRRRRRYPRTDGRYRFEGTVGEGAMGRILLATDARLHRQVAYKAMADDLVEQPTLASKFSAEAQITAQLEHPNIVPVYALESETAYTMKLIEGQTLERALDSVRAAERAGSPVPEPWDLERRLDVFLRVCEAVSYAHSRGVIHRDLKPENIMVGHWGEVYVMDWGIAKVFDERVHHPIDLGTPADDEGDLIIGTAGFMSPEQAEGKNAELGPASDQYALGLILFELVSLRPAVTGKAPMKLILRHQDGEVDPLKPLGRQPIPRELAAIVRRATMKDISRRYASVADLAEDVRRYQRGAPVIAAPDGPLQAVSRWMGRHRELTLFFVTAAVMASVLTVATAIGLGQIHVAQTQAREQRLSTLRSDASTHASLLDGHFLKSEGLLSVITTAAVEALQRPDAFPTARYTFAEFDQGSTAPPDAERPSRSDRFGDRLVSATTPVFWPGTDADRAAPLADMGRHFQRVLLRSHSEKRAGTSRSMARRTIVDVEIPVTWAFVALDDGTLVSFPGHGGWPEALDVLSASWYRAAAGEQAPVWGRVVEHPSLGHEVITVAQAMIDASDQTLGVAGLALSLPRVLDLMLPAGAAPAAEALLLDPSGAVVLHSHHLRDRARALQRKVPPELLARLPQARSGTTMLGGELWVHDRLTSNGWTYVLVGPEDELLR